MDHKDEVMEVTTKRDGDWTIVHVDGHRAGAVTRYDANTWNGHVDTGQFFTSTQAEAVREIADFWATAQEER